MNQKGFSSLLFVILCPFLMSVLLGLTLIFHTVHRYDGIKHICRQQSLNTQGELKTRLETLLNLNPGAKALRTQRTAAELAYKLASLSGNGPAIAAAALYLMQVKASQIAYGIKQKAILLEAKLAAARGKYQLWRKLRAQQVMVESVADFGLRVVASPSNSPTPDYSVRRPVASAHLVNTSWRMAVTSVLPSSFTSIFTLPTYLTGRCSATIERKEKRWQARIAKDNAL